MPSPPRLLASRGQPQRQRRPCTGTCCRTTARHVGGLHNGSAEFRADIAELPAARREVLARLADWAETREHDGLVRLVTYRGKSGITTLLPYLIGDDAGLVSIVSGKESAYMTFFAACSNAALLTPSLRSKLRSEPN
jgi:hypothetical protein